MAWCGRSLCLKFKLLAACFVNEKVSSKVLILKKYLVSCLLGFLRFGVHLAVLSFSCATEGQTSVIPQWQKGKCESESTLGDTRRGYSVNCAPARLTRVGGIQEKMREKIGAG